MLFQSTSLSATFQVWSTEYRLRINISKIHYNPQMQRRSRGRSKVLLKSNQGEREVEALVKDNLGPDKEELALLQQLGVDKIDWNTWIDLFSSIRYPSQNEKKCAKIFNSSRKSFYDDLSVTKLYDLVTTHRLFTCWGPLVKMDQVH